MDNLKHLLEEKTAQYEALSKEFGSFLHAISHELRTPLHIISGFADILDEEHREELNDDGKKTLDILRQNIKNMGNTINDLLQFSRLDHSNISRFNKL